MTDKQIVRLSVNMNAETADALRSLANARGTNITEAVRWAISVAAFVDGELRAGRKIHTVRADGKKRRELVIQ